MKFIIDKVVVYMEQNAEIDQELSAVYAYGLKIMLEIAVSVICTFSAAAFLGKFWEVLIIYLVIFPLRSYGGGFHFQHYGVCLMTSIGFVAAILVIHKNMVISDADLVPLTCISVAYMLLKGVTKEPGRDYTEKEEQYYNLRLKIIFLIILVVVILSGMWRMYTIIRLISVTIFMLSFVKIAGDIKYGLYIGKRRKEG